MDDIVTKQDLADQLTAFAQSQDYLLSADQAKRMASVARAGWRLATNDAGGKSQIGGEPLLPPNFAWPVRSANTQAVERLEKDIERYETPGAVSWATDAQVAAFKQEAIMLKALFSKPYPLHFLAQIDFAAAPRIDNDTTAQLLPDRGIFCLFYDMVSQPWGFDPADKAGFQCAYFENMDDLSTRPLPDEFAAPAFVQSSPPPSLRRLKPVPALFPASAYGTAIERLKLPEEASEAYSAFLEDFAANAPDHRLMGVPYLVQGEMETEAALVSNGIYAGDGKAYSNPAHEAIRQTAPEWTLLLQIDTDEDKGFMWGDSAKLYVWIRKADLATRRFDRCWVILQSY